MKRLAALTLALLMALGVACASAETYTAGSFYTLDYPEELTLDNETYTADTTEDYIWLFMLNGDYVIDAALTPAEGYEGVNLYEANEDERQTYLDDTLDAFANDSAEYVDVLTSTGGYPFYIFTMDSDDGPYYYAETLIQGTSVNFCCYYDDETAGLDQDLLDSFMATLSTVRPVDEADGQGTDAVTTATPTEGA